MKKVICIFALSVGFCLIGSVAQAQNGTVLDSNVQPLHLSSHDARATAQPLAAEQNLSSFNSSSAKGERPVWEFGHTSEVEPLGDFAREVREEKKTAKKSDIVYVNY